MKTAMEPRSSWRTATPSSSEFSQRLGKQLLTLVHSCQTGVLAGACGWGSVVVKVLGILISVAIAAADAPPALASARKLADALRYEEAVVEYQRYLGGA